MMDVIESRIKEIEEEIKEVENNKSVDPFSIGYDMDCKMISRCYLEIKELKDKKIFADYIVERLKEEIK